MTLIDFMKTALLLAVLYDSETPPLTKIAAEYFNHDKQKMQPYARQQKYPFPVFRTAGQKSEWRVAVEAFGEYLDKIKLEAVEQYKALNH